MNDRFVKIATILLVVAVTGCGKSQPTTEPSSAAEPTSVPPSTNLAPIPANQAKASSYLKLATDALATATDDATDNALSATASAQASLHLFDTHNNQSIELKLLILKYSPWSTLSRIYARTGDPAQAQKYLELAEKMIPPIPEPNLWNKPDSAITKISVEAYTESIVQAYIAEGNLSAAERLVAPLYPSACKARLLRYVGDAYAKLGNKTEASTHFHHALAALVGLEGLEKFNAVSETKAVAVSDCQISDDAAALLIASEAALEAQIPCLAAIARAQAERGDPDSMAAGKKTLEMIQAKMQTNQNLPLSTETLSDIAIALSKLGLQTNALSTMAFAKKYITAIHDGAVGKSTQLIYFSHFQSLVGDNSGAKETLKEALNSAQKMAQSDLPAQAFSSIAQQQLHLNDIDGAHQTLLLLLAPDMHASPTTVAGCAELMVRKTITTNPDADLSWIETLPTKSEQAAAYATAASACVDPGP